MKKTLIAISVLHLTGCAAVGPQVAKVAAKYCAQPYDARMAIRSEVNGLIAPNMAMIWCDGDPDYQSPNP